MSKRILSLLLVLVMLVGCFASCALFNQKDNGDDDDDKKPVIPEGPTYTVETFTGDYVYKDSVGSISSNWNPHTYRTNDESYPISFLTTGLYGFVFNDELINTVEGKDPFTGYKIIPEMAADMPVDVTEAIKVSNPEYGIPASATSGYAYKIALNPNATWENGTPINADTYVYSMKMLLDPDYANYRGVDYFDGSLEIANARNYYYQGSTSYTALGVSVSEYLENGGSEDALYVDMNFWGMEGALDANGNEAPRWILATDTTLYFDSYYEDDPENPEAWISAKDIYDYFLGPNGSYVPYSSSYLGTATSYDDDYSFDNVGIFKSGEYEITLVLGKSLAGFNLLYNLSGNWIVYQPYYDDCMTKMEDSDAYTTTYNTSLETTMSYGPYKMTSFETDKSMVFERNTNWFGYTDGLHIYKDPENGKVYPMYQTTKITCEAVPEADTRKLMFLKGQLMGYGLQSADFEEYRDSEYCYATPSETIFFFIFNGHIDAINEREAAFNDNEKATIDLQTMTLNSFRRAVAVSFDKEAFCTAISPSRSGGYGLIGNSYIYDPDTGARYRDTDQAKKALCEFYSVDISAFESLDDAVASITGFDVDTAKQYYAQAYQEALEKGYITDADNDGKSDQTVTITYASDEAGTSFIQKTLQYFNDRLVEVTAGTPFEGKIVFVESASLGDEWSEMLRNGVVDTCLAGWSGSALDPFGLTDLYTNPARAYDAKWFDATKVNLTINVPVNGVDTEVTMTLKEWSDALNGTTVTVKGTEYCFGEGIADVETRLDILAAIETEVLGTYNYIPMLQDASMALLSKQVYYVVEEYNPIMGRGGIAYLKYNYNEADWAEYIKSQNGELSY